MSSISVAELESLVTGGKAEVEFSDTSDREEIMQSLQSVLFNFFPGIIPKGMFMNSDTADYLVYDLHISHPKVQFKFIRILDFGEHFKLIRM